MSSAIKNGSDLTAQKRRSNNERDALIGKMNKKQRLENGKKKSEDDEKNNTTPKFEDEFEMMSLEEIKCSVIRLCNRVPTVPSDGINADDPEAVLAWAEKLQTTIEEFNLVLSCVSPATYRWGSDRSGAADQSLTHLSSELNHSQEQITSACSTRLSNVLAPVVDLVVSKIEKTIDEETGKQVKVQTYTNKIVDPGFHHLCRRVLCRNARMLRQVTLGNLRKVVKVIEDYQKAAKKDSHRDRSLVY